MRCCVVAASGSRTASVEAMKSILSTFALHEGGTRGSSQKQSHRLVLMKLSILVMLGTALAACGASGPVSRPTPGPAAVSTVSPPPRPPRGGPFDSDGGTPPPRGPAAICRQLRVPGPGGLLRAAAVLRHL